jgi:hypothetical protein
MRVFLVLSVIIALTFRAAAQANRERESELSPGPFPQVAGSELGKPIDFENEIDTHACFPLLMNGEVVTWIHRAHAALAQVLVQRCVEFDPAITQTRGNRHGGVREAWDRVVPDRGGHGVQFVAVTPRAWGHFANPSFCGPLVAYWGTAQDTLARSIHDIRTGQLVASRSLGSVELETDDESYLPRPAWDAPCVKATFDGRRAGKGRVELPLKR